MNPLKPLRDVYLLLSAFMAAIVFSIFFAPPAFADRPNVLFISVDDLNDFPAFMQRYPDAKHPTWTDSRNNRNGKW